MIFGDNSPYTKAHNFTSFGDLRKLVNQVVSLFLDRYFIFKSVN